MVFHTLVTIGYGGRNSLVEFQMDNDPNIDPDLFRQWQQRQVGWA